MDRVEPLCFLLCYSTPLTIQDFRSRCDGELAMRRGDNRKAEKCFIQSQDWRLLEMLYFTTAQHDKLAAVVASLRSSRLLKELAIGDATFRTMALERAGRPVLACINAMACHVMNQDAARLLAQLCERLRDARYHCAVPVDDPVAVKNQSLD